MKRLIRANLVAGRLGLFYFQFVAGNGVMLATSQAYTNRRKCRAALNRILDEASFCRIPVTNVAVLEPMIPTSDARQAMPGLAR